MDTRNITFTKSELLYLISTLKMEIETMENIVENTENNNYAKERLATLKISHKKIHDAFYK